jgi:hypothetical protein
MCVESVNEESVNEESVNEESVNEESVNEEAIKKAGTSTVVFVCVLGGGGLCQQLVDWNVPVPSVVVYNISRVGREGVGEG